MGTIHPVALTIQVALASLTPVLAAAAGLVTDDPTLSPYQERTATYIDRCGKADSHVERSSCLYDQIQSLRIRVVAEMKKRVADAEAMAADEPFAGTTGKEKAVIVKADLRKGQAAWEAYNKTTCEAAAREIGIGGGNGGDLAQASCEIRHYVARLNELRGR